MEISIISQTLQTKIKKLQKTPGQKQKSPQKIPQKIPQKSPQKRPQESPQKSPQENDVGSLGFLLDESQFLPGICMLMFCESEKGHDKNEKFFFEI